MERKIEYYEEEGIADYANLSMEECVESWRDNLDKEIAYPCEIVVYRYAGKNKNEMALNDIHDDLYIDDYSEKYYTNEMIECSDN